MQVFCKCFLSSGIRTLAALICVLGLSSCFLAAAPAPPATGKLVDLGGHRLHVNCTGKGSPTVVIENGLGDFSFDWILVQSKVAGFSRVCTYDRAGYAWSDPGPKPRTFAQINLELHDALLKLGERGPYVLVGHSYGGPVARNFALTYPHSVVGMVLVDSAFEGEHVPIGGGKTIRLGEGAKGGAIPPPHQTLIESDKPAVHAEELPDELKALDPMFKPLPQVDQDLQLWAQQLPQVYDAQGSETEWSTEYFAKWLAAPQTGTLGAIPLMVLTRAEGGYGNDLDVPATQMNQELKDGQTKLTLLSTNHKQIFISSGHNMNLEAPDDVSSAIHDVVEAVRSHGLL